MKYKVISQFKLDSEEVEENAFDFDNMEDALDYYRDGLKTMAETIADYGGEFIINLLSYEGMDVEILKRNNVQTLINRM